MSDPMVDELAGVERNREVNRQLKAKKGPYYDAWKRNIVKGAKSHGKKRRK